ncbi:MAG: hypothetical protein ABW184_09930 [Sphingobium sp.]
MMLVMQPDSLSGPHALQALGLGVVVAIILVVVGFAAKRAGARYGDRAGMIVGASMLVLLVLNAQFGWL